MNPYLNTVLCEETYEEIAYRMRELLTGKHFAVITGNSYSKETDNYSSVEVDTSQYLTKGGVEADMRFGYPRIAWSTPRIHWSISSHAKTRAEGHNGKPHDWVRVSFDPNKLTIDQYAPARYRLLWVFAVETHREENFE